MLSLSWRKGQEVVAAYYREGGRGRERPEPKLVTARISAVGRRWITLQDLDGRRIDRFDPFDPEFEIDGGDWGSPGRVFLSEEHYQLDRERRRLWGELGERFRHFASRPPATLELEPLQQILAALVRAEAAEELFEEAVADKRGD